MREQDKLIERARYDARAEQELADDLAGRVVSLGSQSMADFLQTPYVFYEQKIAALVGPSHQVLELAAGTGLHTAALLQTGAHVVATDISPSSLRLLAQRFSHLAGNLETKVADMERLPFEDSSFDVIACAGGLSYGEPALVDSEIHRVLKPGGLLICVDSLNHNPIYRLNRWFHFLRGNRTKSTLKRMPNLSRIKAFYKDSSIKDVRFFGAITFAMPALSSLLGASFAKSVSDAFDKLIGTKRLAFKFVMVVRDCSNLVPDNSLSEVEPILHYTRFEQTVDNSKDTLDAIVLSRLLDANIVLPYKSKLAKAYLFGNRFGLSAKGYALLNYFVFFNFFFGNVYLILVCDELGMLVHRSTVMRRDFRRPHLPGGFEVTQVWTHVGHRGKGIALGVLKSLLAASPGCQFHWCVRASNKSSISVAENAGLALCDRYVPLRFFGITFFSTT